MKKIIIVFMMLITLPLLVSCNENENTDFIYELKSFGTQIGLDTPIEGYEISSYLGTEENVEIPSFIGNIEVISVASNAFRDNENVLSVIIPDTVKLISTDSFRNAINLENIFVDENNTHYFDFEGSVYSKYDPDKIILVTVPEGKTGNFNLYNKTFEILGSSFQSCIKLRSITITNLEDVWIISPLSYSILLQLDAIYVPENKLDYYKDLISFHNSYLEDLIVISE